MKMNNRTISNHGFTIVELIVVVTVFGLLAAIAVGAYNKVVNDAKVAKSTAHREALASLKLEIETMHTLEERALRLAEQQLAVAKAIDALAVKLVSRASNREETELAGLATRRTSSADQASHLPGGDRAGQHGLVNTLSTAKSLFAADSKTTPAEIQTYDAAPDGNFAMIAPYIRVNGAQPQSEADCCPSLGFRQISPLSWVRSTIGDLAENIPTRNQR